MTRLAIFVISFVVPVLGGILFSLALMWFIEAEIKNIMWPAIIGSFAGVILTIFNLKAVS